MHTQHGQRDHAHDAAAKPRRHVNWNLKNSDDRAQTQRAPRRNNNKLAKRPHRQEQLRGHDENDNDVFVFLRMSQTNNNQHEHGIFQHLIYTD